MSQGTAHPAAGQGIEVRHCHNLEEYNRCMELEREVWGSADLDVVPSTIFVVAEETGGQILGAFDHEAGGKMVGFTLALAAFRGGQRYLHSHMTAVLPAYQNRGIGRMLKLLQRQDALERGIELVEWTFDPLEVRNAHFNLMRLGAIVRRFLPNVYGITTSPLHGGMPTDRLVAEWWIASPRVRTCVGENPASAQATNGRPLLGTASPVQVLVPAEMPEWKKTDRNKALEAQRHIAGEFQKWFGRGYAAAGLELSAQGGRYLLVPYDSLPGRTK